MKIPVKAKNVLNAAKALYQDRLDSQVGEAHCDDCGEVFTEKEYLKIMKGEMMNE